MASYRVLSTTLLAAALVLGNFADSAEAFTRNRQTRSSRGFCTGIENIFTLVTVDVDGSSIVDESSDLGLGYFSNAVADYVTFDIKSPVSRCNLNPSAGIPIENIDSFSSFNDLISSIELQGFTSTNIGPLDLKAEKLVGEIQYSFIDSESAELVLDVTISSASTVSEGSGDFSSFSEEDKGKLINELPFIIDNFDWRFLQDDNPESLIQSFIAEAVFVEDRPESASVPEPEIFGNLMFLSFLGFGVKRALRRMSTVQ